MIVMKLVLSFTLAASCIGVCLSQSQTTITDTNLAVRIDSNGIVSAIQNLDDSFSPLVTDWWSVGIRNDSNSVYDAKCDSSIANVKSFIYNATSATSVATCPTSELIIIHDFQRSKSTQMIKATITLLNNGSSAFPVVQYRRFTDYTIRNVGDLITTKGTQCLITLVSTCFAQYDSSNDIAYDDFAGCSAAVASIPSSRITNYKATYEFRFRPINANQSVSFDVFYGGSGGEAASFVELCKNDVQVGSLWKRGDSALGLPYSYYVGYSGVGGNNNTFCPASSGGGGFFHHGSHQGGHDHICFSSMNTVEEKNRGIMLITELKIGDFVKTGTGQYTQVYGFGHLDHHRKEAFIQLHLVDDAGDDSNKDIPTTIEISSNHLIFVGPNDRSYPIRAANVVVGDLLSGRKVVKVSDVVRRGLYAPLTMSGDIAVSSVRSSNYVDLLGYSGRYNRHVVGHAAFAPQRLFCRYFMDICRKETYSTGYGSYTRFILWCVSIIKHLVWMTSRCALVVVNISLFPATLSVCWVGLLFIFFRRCYMYSK